MLIDYTVHIWREGSQYIARAMPVDVASSGRSPDEARHALGEAVDLFLSTTQSMGTLEDVLLECGYERHEGRWTAPEWIAVERRSTQLIA